MTEQESWDLLRRARSIPTYFRRNEDGTYTHVKMVGPDGFPALASIWAGAFAPASDTIRYDYEDGSATYRRLTTVCFANDVEIAVCEKVDD